MSLSPKKRRLDSFSDSIDRSSDEEMEYANKQAGLVHITVTRTLTCPDMVQVDRCLRLPEYGPKILFFSGGSAIRDLSSVLKNYTHNSVHLITPFDSGGSSAELRRAFNIVSIGDLRNRLMALSDESVLGNPEVTALFSFRLDKHDKDKAKAEFQDILSGCHSLAKAIGMPMRIILCRHLEWFFKRMPDNFDLCGASIGNLIITGCYLEHNQDIVTAIFLIRTLLGIKGTARLITGANLHIRAKYEDGLEQVGQHLLGKRKHSKIKEIDLVKLLQQNKNNNDGTTQQQQQRQESQNCHIDIVSSELIADADVIVFPMGSFFGSILANLLPEGVGKAIWHRKSPKIYIPNTGVDPEMYGFTSLTDCVHLILDMIKRDIGTSVPTSQLLNFVLIDSKNCNYCIPINKEEIEALGITIIDVQLVSDDYLSKGKEKSDRLDPTKITEVLLTLGS